MTWIGNEPVQRRARILSEGVTNALTSSIQIAGGYTVGNIVVFINGNRLQTNEFDDSDGYVITFVDELPVNTEWVVEDIQAFESVSVIENDNPGTIVKRGSTGEIYFDPSGTSLSSQSIEDAIRELLSRIETLEGP